MDHSQGRGKDGMLLLEKGGKIPEFGVKIGVYVTIRGGWEEGKEKVKDPALERRGG